MQGVADAMAAGNVKLAAEILWTELQIVYERGKNTILGIASDLWHGVLAGANEAFYGLQVAWIELTAAMAKAWHALMVSIQASLAAVQKLTGDLLSKIGGFVGGELGTGIQALGAGLSSTAGAGLPEQAQEAGRRMGEAETDRRQRREDAKELRDAMESEIGQRSLDAQRDREERLRELRRQRDEALQQAEEEREQIEAGEGPGSKLQQMLDDFAEAIGGATALADRQRAVGTFSAAALRGMGGRVEDRTARAAENLDRRVAGIERKLDEGGALAFS
jgi:hypothetical protein